MNTSYVVYEEVEIYIRPFKFRFKNRVKIVHFTYELHVNEWLKWYGSRILSVGIKELGLK